MYVTNSYRFFFFFKVIVIGGNIGHRNIYFFFSYFLCKVHKLVRNFVNIEKELEQPFFNARRKNPIYIFLTLQISGTAAKLGRPNAYHHCTLLVDVNKSALSLALERKEVNIFRTIITFIVQSLLNS